MSYVTTPWTRLLVAPPAQQARIDRMRAQAQAINQQLRYHEENRMSQAIEHLGGPGTGYSRYVRAVQNTPYAVHPLMPFMSRGNSSGMDTLRRPPSYGVVHRTSEDLDLNGRGPDPAMSALEQGITTTASVKMATEMGRTLAKVANQEQPVPEEFARAVAPTHAQEAGQYAASSASHLGRGLGDAARSVGHGTLAAAGALKGGISGFGRGIRDFMSQEPAGGQRWGAGTPPDAFTNEYGVPLSTY